MKVGVVGLGTMGAGIAQLAVEAGLETVGREVTVELGENARGRIEHFLSRKVEKGQIDSFDIGLLTLTTDVADFADCDVVIEAVVEELDAKRELFGELEQVCRADAVLATNTLRALRSPRSRPRPRLPSASSGCTSSTLRL